MGNSPEIQSPDNEPDETEVGCSICGGTGLIIEAINGTAYAVPCICVRDGGAGALWRHLNTTPFALTPNPASKRGQLEAVDIETAARLDIAAIAREADAFYTNFDPFTGEWGLYGQKTPGLVAGKGRSRQAAHHRRSSALKRTRTSGVARSDCRQS